MIVTVDLSTSTSVYELVDPVLYQEGDCVVLKDRGGPFYALYNRHHVVAITMERDEDSDVH